MANNIWVGRVLLPKTLHVCLFYPFTEETICTSMYVWMTLIQFIVLLCTVEEFSCGVWVTETSSVAISSQLCNKFSIWCVSRITQEPLPPEVVLQWAGFKVVSLKELVSHLISNLVHNSGWRGHTNMLTEPATTYLTANNYLY